MSIQAVNWVLQNSRTEHAERLVLIALANHASTDKNIAFPSVQTLAGEARLGRRTVQGAIARLLEVGEIVEVGKTRSGTRCFQFPMAASDSAPAQILHPRRILHQGAQNAASRGADTAPESSGKRKEPSEVNLVFGTWVDSTGKDKARTKLTSDRRRTIKQALRSHGLEDCLAAVTNIGKDKWAGGDNDRGTRYDDIKHALGNAERIERWRDWKPVRSEVEKRTNLSGKCSCGAPIKAGTRCLPCSRKLEEKLTGTAA